MSLHHGSFITQRNGENLRRSIGAIIKQNDIWRHKLTLTNYANRRYNAFKRRNFALKGRYNALKSVDTRNKGITTCY